MGQVKLFLQQALLFEKGHCICQASGREPRMDVADRRLWLIFLSPPPQFVRLCGIWGSKGLASNKSLMSNLLNTYSDAMCSSTSPISFYKARFFGASSRGQLGACGWLVTGREHLSKVQSTTASGGVRQSFSSPGRYLPHADDGNQMKSV